MGMTFSEWCKKAKIDITQMETVEGHYDEIKDWVMDPKGYFLIRIDAKENLLEVAFCPKTNFISYRIIGKKPQDVYFKAIQLGLISRLDHAAYLAKELQKAYTALKFGLEYVQDEELKK